MIKVNLIPVKRKKKAKPLPSFLISVILATVATALIMAYLAFFFSSRLDARKATVANNERRIAELKEQIKAVEDFERRNQDFQKRNEVIEQLSKNKGLPVSVLNEINQLIPKGIWLKDMKMSAAGIDIEGLGFTNTDIVAYVDNLKKSSLFTEVYLIESKSIEIEKIPLYAFKLNFKIKG
jgi:type IV pilus assembly protein PilN